MLVGLSRRAKSAIVLSADVVGTFGGAALAYWLLGSVGADVSDVFAIGAVAVLASLVVAWRNGLYRAVVRYIGPDLLVGAAVTVTVSALAASLFAFALNPELPVLRWATAYAAFSGIYLCASRYLARFFLVNRRSGLSNQSVLIYGAGDAGAKLAGSLQGTGEFVPVAMVDDDRTLHRKKVNGLTVFSPADIGALVDRLNIKRVLLAMPSASRRSRRAVLERLSKFPVRVQTMPDVKDILTGKAQVDDIRDVDVKDLLGRDPVPPKQELMGESVARKNVMITGAGGSIGSELCRQILRLGPRRLVLFDVSEAALYNIKQSLLRIHSEIGSSCEIVPLLGSVHHENRVREVLETFEIQTVFHAAAYKHVPIVEQNVFEGIHNNIFGTLHTVRSAIKSKVEKFVLISTDKAVNPTNVMGATKRFAELVLQSFQESNDSTTLCMVRFGNVLESSGSVVPLFKEQIRRGGPVTVTHRDIIRYFMTIPEASQLVIQAAAMARGGDVFVLDMGKPVKISDLARRMINLMGLTVRDESNPDGDIEIRFVGLRPAEKLFEELLIGENVSGTEHPRIMRADEDFLPYEALNALLEELMGASISLDYDRARRVLLTAVREYEPTNDIDDLIFVRKAAAASGTDRVVDFPKRPG